MDPVDHFISYPNEMDFFAIHVRNMYKFKQKIDEVLQNDVTSNNPSKNRSNNPSKNPSNNPSKDNV